MFIESLRRNWLPLIHRAFFPFCDFTWLPSKSPFSTLLLENLDEVCRFSELLHRDRLCHHVYWILFCTDLHQVNNIFYYESTTQWRILWYLTSMCFVCLWYMWSLARCITLLLSQQTWTESYMLKVLINLLNHKAFFNASTAAMCSTFDVESVTVSCKSVFQLTMHSATMNT